MQEQIISSNLHGAGNTIMARATCENTNTEVMKDLYCDVLISAWHNPSKIPTPRILEHNLPLFGCEPIPPPILPTLDELDEMLKPLEGELN